MKNQVLSDDFVGVPSLNAVALNNAVLCADCDVVSDSPHDKCLVCGSRSLFNISKILGGNLPMDRARLTNKKTGMTDREDSVIQFPTADRTRRMFA
jgi:hypothetical protein